MFEFQHTLTHTPRPYKGGRGGGQVECDVPGHRGGGEVIGEVNRGGQTSMKENTQ